MAWMGKGYLTTFLVLILYRGISGSLQLLLRTKRYKASALYHRLAGEDWHGPIFQLGYVTGSILSGLVRGTVAYWLARWLLW